MINGPYFIYRHIRMPWLCALRLNCSVFGRVIFRSHPHSITHTNTYTIYQWATLIPISYYFDTLRSHFRHRHQEWCASILYLIEHECGPAFCVRIVQIFGILLLGAPSREQCSQKLIFWFMSVICSNCSHAGRHRSFSIRMLYLLARTHFLCALAEMCADTRFI